MCVCARAASQVHIYIIIIIIIIMIIIIIIIYQNDNIVHVSLTAFSLKNFADTKDITIL